MSLTVLIRLKETRPPDVTVREWRPLIRAAHHETGEYYHAHVLPRHFENGAQFKYDYRPRSPNYRRRKARLGKTQPLVFTGTLQRSLTEYASIRGFPSRFRVVMHGPTYIPKRPMSTKQPRIYDEVTSILESERQELAEVLKSAIARRIREVT